MHSQLLEQPQPAEDSTERGLILIVEDDSSIAEVLTIRLHRQGFRALATGLGRRALPLAREHRPALILLDLRLPDVDGLQVCRQLDDDPQTAAIPKIVLSGMERPDIIRQTRTAGCQYYVRKPYDPNALLVLIEQAIGEC